MADVEIRITSKNQGGGGFSSSSREAKVLETDLKKVARAADIDGKLSMDDGDLKQTDRLLDRLEADADIDGKLDMDNSDIKQTGRLLDGLDTDVDVDIDTNADEAVSEVEGAFDGIDVSDVGGTIAGQITGALGKAGPVGKALAGQSTVQGAVGCARCLGTGYRGRVALFELLDVTDELRDVILGEPSIQAMRRVIDSGLFTTIGQFGWRLVAKGVTSIEEVERVAGLG